MIVEDLVPDPRRPGSTRVIVGGRPVWTVPADVIATLSLVVGARLRGEVTERLDRAADEEGAFRAGLRALERRAHGERELAMKLERKGHLSIAIVPAIERLRSLGLLDDIAFTKAYINSKRERGRGPFRLRHDLSLLGIPRELVDRILAEATSPDGDALEQPRRLIAKRARQLASLPVETRRRRLLAYLGRRGYRGSEARGMVEEALLALAQ